jgi:hypothetical protein
MECVINFYLTQPNLCVKYYFLIIEKLDHRIVHREDRVTTKLLRHQ